MKRLGLVGVGAWGQRYVQTAARRRDFQLAAYTRASARAHGDLAQARRCAHWQELLQLATAGDLDGIIVATTPDNQAEVAAAARTVGVPALVEKPLGLCKRAVERVIACAGNLRHPSPLVVNYVHLFAPAYRALRTRVFARDALYAPIEAIESSGCNLGPVRGWPAFYDFGVHDIAMALDLVGPEAEFMLRGVERIRTPDNLPGQLCQARFALGRVEVTSCFGNAAPAKVRRLAVTMRGGRKLVYDDCAAHPSKLIDANVPVPIEQTLPLDAALTFFLESCELWASGQSVPESACTQLQFTLRVAEIMDAIAQEFGRCP
jgi:predicted dehydrogenase